MKRLLLMHLDRYKQTATNLRTESENSHAIPGKPYLYRNGHVR